MEEERGTTVRLTQLSVNETELKEQVCLINTQSFDGQNRQFSG